MCDCDTANSDINESVVQTVKHNGVRAQRNFECRCDVGAAACIGIMFH
jgi:hypothetical protein